VVFWTTTFADVVSEDYASGRSAQRGIRLSAGLLLPAEVEPAIQHIIFDEWQLPRRASAASAPERWLDENTSAQ
jgi:hypothetical protein